MMSKKKTLLILWIIFGFAAIQAIDSVLYFLNNLIYFGVASLKVPYTLLYFILPIISISTYLLTLVLLVKRVKIDSGLMGNLLTKFPKNQFIILLILAIVLNPITNKLSGLFAGWTAENITHTHFEIISLYGWVHLGIGVARWLSLIILAIIYLKKHSLNEYEN